MYKRWAIYSLYYLSSHFYLFFLFNSSFQAFFIFSIAFILSSLFYYLKGYQGIPLTLLNFSNRPVSDDQLGMCLIFSGEFSTLFFYFFLYSFRFHLWYLLLILWQYTSPRKSDSSRVTVFVSIFYHFSILFPTLHSSFNYHARILTRACAHVITQYSALPERISSLICRLSALFSHMIIIMIKLTCMNIFAHPSQ